MQETTGANREHLLFLAHLLSHIESDSIQDLIRAVASVYPDFYDLCAVYDSDFQVKDWKQD